MATITQYQKKDGTLSYTAQIRIKRGGEVVWSESNTFGSKRLAAAWAKKREVELAEPGVLDRLVNGNQATLADLAKRYLDEFSDTQAWGRSKLASIKAIPGWKIAQRAAVDLTTPDFVAHVQERRAAGTGPATALNDLIWAGIIFKTARSAWGIPLHDDVIRDASAVCRAQRLVAKAKERDRRPTPAELERLLAHWRRKDDRMQIPMAEIIEFAAASARRQEEITRLLWSDLEEEVSVCLLRDVKHPREKWGNHKKFRLTKEALAIIQRQPKTDERIFPYDAKSVSAAFTRACPVLGIEDLHFHDLRHEATCRLFERGYPIHEVAMFTLHESWATLKRYTHLRPEDVPER